MESRDVLLYTIIEISYVRWVARSKGHRTSGTKPSNRRVFRFRCEPIMCVHTSWHIRTLDCVYTSLHCGWMDKCRETQCLNIILVSLYICTFDPHKSIFFLKLKSHKKSRSSTVSHNHKILDRPNWIRNIMCFYAKYPLVHFHPVRRCASN